MGTILERMYKKILFSIPFVVFILLAANYSQLFSFVENETAKISGGEPVIKDKTEIKSEKKIDDADLISIVGVGDMMLGSNFPPPGNLPRNGGKDIFNSVTSYLNDADLTIGNLEGPIMTNDAPLKKCLDSAYNYTFKMPDDYANNFKAAGFKILNLANNHIGDFGRAGIKNTMRVLNNAGIKFAGTRETPFTIYETKNLKIGFCAFSPNSECFSVNDLKSVKSIVRHLDSLCDFVIVSMHIGAEGTAQRHITFQDEIFLNEKRGNPYLFARTAIDAGADVVLGHGPHVIRAVDIYKNKFIAYSLGNFFTFSGFNINGCMGRGPILKLFVKNNGDFVKAHVVSTVQKRGGMLLNDDKNSALKEIINLTSQDFPKSELMIGNDGWIFKLQNNN